MIFKSGKAAKKAHTIIFKKLVHGNKSTILDKKQQTRKASNYFLKIYYCNINHLTVGLFISVGKMFQRQQIFD